MASSYGYERKGVCFLLAALLWSACSDAGESTAMEDDPARSADDDRAEHEDEREPRDEEDDDAVTAVKDAGAVKVDAGKKPVSELDGASKPADRPSDASTDATLDAAGPRATQDGGSSGSRKDGGEPSRADATVPGSSGAQCALTRYQAGESSALRVNGGVPVSGAGCAQQWEGIVMTQGGRGLCTAAFISERHLISASHCYANDGAVSVRVSAPTWDNGASHTFQAQVKRSGSNMTLDVSIIDLGKAVEWATPERRFVLHAGKASAVDLHLYGFGSGGSSGAAGTLRGIPNRATLRVTDNGRGTLSGKAGPAQLCTGDSGGPAFVEKTAAVLYGINQAIVPGRQGGGRTCASSDWTIMFTNVSEYVSFVEQALGKPCERKRVDDLDVAQCW